MAPIELLGRTRGSWKGWVLLPVKVINLVRSEDRRNAFIEINQGLDYEFIPAIDGLSVDKQTLIDQKLFESRLQYTPGAIGCALSHLHLWEWAIAENQAITIAEDDAIFREDFSEKADLVISQLPADWDFILWGWNFDALLTVDFLPNVSRTFMGFDQYELRKSIDYFKKLTTPSIPLRLNQSFGIPAYSISPAGAQKFKAMCFPLSVFEVFYRFLDKSLPNSGIDNAMSRIYSSTQSFVCFPPLVVTKNEQNISTVQELS
jgi:GR25 family glycosyltransferase involved in LPS biosynthesis